MSTFNFSDTSVNILLPNPTSRAFLECLSSYSNPFKSISIFDTKELPENHLWKGAMGVCTPVQNRVVSIYVNITKLQNEGFPVGSWEVISAHELLHKWLGAKGYPIVSTGKRFSNEPIVREIADRLGSLSQHPLIKQKLSTTKLITDITYDKIGFLHREHVRKLLTDKRIASWKKGTPGFTLAILECLEWYFIYPESIKECDNLLDTLNVQYSQTIKACLKDREKLYGNPSAVVAALRRWRLTLNIEDKVSILDVVNKRWH